MLMLKSLWQTNCFQLLFGMFGIYTCYWIAGILQQKVLKRPYLITNTIQWETFQSPIALLYIPCGVAWLSGFLINNIFYKQHTKMPPPNLIACATMVCISTHTYMLAIYLTSFPIVMLVKSCNIVSVVVVGVFCSRVRDKSLSLGPKKIFVASMVSVGIILYNFGGDQKHKEKATDPLGLILLFISLVADGFLPDFQAVIKSQYQPRPLEMFEHINKWVTILSLTYGLISGNLIDNYNFVQKFPQIGSDMLILAILTTLGQVFVYRMIKQFKQHIVPFVITTRKIFTVVISIILYGHTTTPFQITAIILIFGTTSYEYLSQIYYSKQSSDHQLIASEQPEREQMTEKQMEIQNNQQSRTQIKKTLSRQNDDQSQSKSLKTAEQNQ